MATFTRREFLTTLEAIGMAAALDGFNWARAAQETTGGSSPTKVAELKGKPVLTIAHCCDPQLGFGIADSAEQAYADDLRRLKKEIELINAAQPDLALFAGDMTNRWQEVGKDWPELLKSLKVPFLVAPGNHDIPDPLKASGVTNFTGVFGKEYDSVVVNGWKIIAINSQYCRPTDEKALYDAQVEWFRNELESAKSAGLRSIVASHVPPFVKQFEEKDEYFNFPTELRKTYLDYLIANDATFYLAGHTHTTLERQYLGLPILNAETTSQNFDRHDFGFRTLKIDDELNYVWDFVEVEKNPAQKK